jgi:hypothetical protein
MKGTYDLTDEDALPQTRWKKELVMLWQKKTMLAMVC